MGGANGQHKDERVLSSLGGDRRLQFFHGGAIGTGEDVVNGKASYYAWYEMYPSDSVIITTPTSTSNGSHSFTVQPGDKITASVAYVGSAFVLTIKDTTEANETFQTTLTIKGAARSSAEWVVEAPSSNSGVLPLASFGTVTFTNAYATINGTTDPINYWQSYSINMESRSGVEDSTSALSDTAATSLPTATTTGGYSGNVSSFTVTYNATSPVTPTPPPSPRRGGGWGWREPMISQITVGHSGSSQLASIGDDLVRDQLFASSEMFDLLDLRV